MAVVLPFVYQLAVSVAISYVAGALLSKKPDGNVVKDFKATPLADRGSPINFLIGRDVIGPVYTWAGNRQSDTAAGAGGKGTSGSDAGGQLIYFEDGWHALCVGPARRLWNIKENDKVIYKGPIDSSSHPSGTVIDLGPRGKFRIFWGEQDQPTIDRLGESDSLGITSRWPFLCSVEWIKKKLGPSPIWGRITYEMEEWPYNTKLVASPPFFQATKSLVGGAIALETGIGQIADGPTGTNFVTIQSGSNDFKPTQFAQLVGCGVADGDYIIDHVDKVKVGSTKFRKIFFGQTMIGLTATGSVQAFKDNKDDGVNPAHILYQAHFESFPHGRGLDPALFDIGSLEDVGIVCEQEGLRSTIITPDFVQWDSVIADILQDIGCLVAPSPVDGRLTFRMVRPNVDIAILTDGVITGPRPEIGNTIIDGDLANRRRFGFRDRDREYETTPIKIDDDGQAVVEQCFGQALISMPTVRDFTTGAVVAKRRNQEAYSAERWQRLRANRQAQLLKIGQLFTIPDDDEVWILLERERSDPDSGEVQLSALPNYYGIEANQAVVNQGGGAAPDVEDSDEDIVDIPFEVPQLLNDTGVVLLSVARIRASAGVSGADIYVSQDDSTFEFVGKELSIATGGTLVDPMPADGPSLIDDGPIITAEGPDILNVLDLSAVGKLTDWQAGRQVYVMSDGTNYEIGFMRWLEALGGDQYQMHGLMRHRHGTLKQAFAAGSFVVIFERDEIKRLSDLLIVPNETLFVKALPVGNGSVSLDDLESVSDEVYGEGVRPLPVVALRAGDVGGSAADSFYFPNDITIRWGYRGAPGANTACPATLPAGDPVLDRPPSDGTVRVQITDPNDGDAVVRTTDLPFDNTGELAYPQSQIKTDFGLGAGYSPGTAQMNWRSTAPSPAITGVSGLIQSATLDSGTSAAASLSIGCGAFTQVRAVAVTLAGVPGLGAWPAGNHSLAVKFPAGSTFPNGTDPDWKVTAQAARFNSADVLQAAGPASAAQVVGDGTFTFILAPDAGPWPGAAAGDRFGAILIFEKNSGGTGLASIEVNAGTTFVTGPLFNNPFVDLDVRVSVIKGGQQSSIEVANILNLGGTTT